MHLLISNEFFYINFVGQDLKDVFAAKQRSNDFRFSKKGGQGTILVIRETQKGMELLYPVKWWFVEYMTKSGVRETITVKNLTLK